MPGRHAHTARRQQLTSKPGFGGLLLNALAAAVGLGVVIGVVAYAVTIPDPGTASSGASAWRALLPARPGSAGTFGGPAAPRIVGHPALAATSTSATFRFTEPPQSAPFRCRLDRDGWAPCHSPVAVDDLGVGAHDFLVRGAARPGGAPASSLFPWTVFQPQPFSIAPQLSHLSDLYPGAPPVVLPLKVVNPNGIPIAVTSLQVSVSRDPPGCPSAENLELVQSNASSAAPLRIRAGGSAWVPGHGIHAPAIRLRELPVNQDACERARFPLVFTGSAHG